MKPNRSVPPASVVPVLSYPDVRAAVAWLSAAFGIVERTRIGEYHRAQMSIGADGAMIVAELRGDQPPDASMTHLVRVRVEDVSAQFERACAHGARVIEPVTDREYGERDFTVVDLAGHRWQFAETVRDVAPEELGFTTVAPWPDHQDRSAELQALTEALDRQRAHVLGILEGLSEEDLRRPVLPSGWNCLELVRHLTVDVELFWFPGVFAAEPDLAHQLRVGAMPHWQVPEGMSADDVFRDYRAAVDRANAVVAAAAQRSDPLDQEPAAWPVDFWPTWRLPDLRHILIHVLTEVACHTGHLDAARELIDGTQWLGGSPYPD